MRMGSNETPPRIVRPLETLILMRPVPLWKRAMDLVGAAVALMVFLPIMLVAAVAVKLTSKGPVIFTQRRAGLGGRPFTIYKFRSMRAGAEEERADLTPDSHLAGPAFKMDSDPRCTAVGRLMRRWSVDELPQLWNVLRGDMSLVGPRPLPCQESHDMSFWHRRRLLVTPGMTCIWQISGRSLVGFDDWIRMDIQYADNRSLWLDLRILAMTVPAVLSRIGACCCWPTGAVPTAARSRVRAGAT